jgi:osmotically-inducible protein OsmY
MRIQNIAASSLSICLLLSGLALIGSGCAGSGVHRSTGAYVDDKGISTRVKTALFRDPLVSGFDVHVDTFRGDVQLSGFVDNSEQKARAAEIARGVSGVQTVTNNLEVKPASTAVGAPGSTVSGTSSGLTQPVPERPAADAPRVLAPVRSSDDDVNRRLAPTAPATTPLDTRPLDTPRLDTRVPPSNYEVSASNGHAVLRGTVASESEKRDIERRIRELPGIRHVDNRLEILSTR